MFKIVNCSVLFDSLTSIAYMKAAVSKLLEIEAEKIHIFAQSESTISRMMKSNDSLQKQLIRLESLQQLLLNKYKLITNLIEFQGLTQEEEPESEKTAEAKADISEGEHCKPPQADGAEISLFKGRGQGRVTNIRDPYGSGLAIFQAYITNYADGENRKSFMNYSVMRGTEMGVLISSPGEMKAVFSPDPDHASIKVEGRGIFSQRERFKADIRKTCEFLFCMQMENSGDETHRKITFEMEIHTGSFTHKSGPISAQGSGILKIPETI